MSRVELTADQFAAMRKSLRKREAAIIEQVLQQPDYPPLPACPECGHLLEEIISGVEGPGFGVAGTTFLINVEPCGHRFRAAVNLDELI